MSASLHFRLFFIQREQETLGVPVVTYGESHNFPAFYSPNSGYKVELEFPALIPRCTQFPLILEPMASK